MKPLLIQGILYLLATPVLFTLAWRFYSYYKTTGSKIAKIFIYPAILGGIDVFLLAILDFFFPYNLKVLFWRQTGVAIFHVLIFISLFWVVIYLKFPDSSKKQVIGLILFLIPVITYVIVILKTSTPPSISPQKFIYWGYSSLANYLKIFIAGSALIPLAFVFFQKMRPKRIRSLLLGFACLVGLMYYFVIYVFKEEVGSAGELFIIALIILGTLLALLVKGSTIIKITMKIVEEEHDDRRI